MSGSEEKSMKRGGFQGNFLRYFLASFAGAVVVVLGVGLLMYFGAIGVREVSRPPSAAPESGISYADFISIMLTTVMVLLAVLTIGIAITAWRAIEEIDERAVRAAREAVDSELKDNQDRLNELEDGLQNMHSDFEKNVRDIVAEVTADNVGMAETEGSSESEPGPYTEEDR